MNQLVQRLNFRQVSELLGIQLDDVRSIVVEERRLPALYVTQVGYAEPYQYQLLKVDPEGRAFDLAVGGIEGAVHTGFLRIERFALERFMHDEGIAIPQDDQWVGKPGHVQTAQGGSELVRGYLTRDAADATAVGQRPHSHHAGSPVVPPTGPQDAPERNKQEVLNQSALERQAHRWQLCIDAGLTMPSDTYASLPRGIGAVAKRLVISRQALAQDLNAHRERLFGK